MTLAAYSPNFYTGTGATATYAYSFPILDEADLQVIQKDATTLVESILTVNTDYTVNGVGEAAGGVIILTAGNLATGDVLAIKRVVDLTQETDVRNQGEFLPEIHEEEFDKLVMADQQLQEQIDRSLKIPGGINPSDFNMTLPADIAENAGASILVNGTGDGLTFGSTSSVTDTTKVAKAGDTMTGHLVMANQKEVRFGDLDNSNYVGIKGPSAVSSNLTLTLPDALPLASSSLVVSSAGVVSYQPNAFHSVSSADYTVTDTDGYSVILVSTGGTDRTITLPSIATNPNRVITVKKTDSGVGSVFVDGSSVEGYDFINLINQHTSITLAADSSDVWRIIASNIADYKSSEVSVEADFAATTVTKDATSLDLDGGVWELSWSLQCNPNGATVTRIYVGIGTVSGNDQTDMVEGVNTFDLPIPVSGTRDAGGALSSYRIVIPTDSTATYYLKVLGTFSVATPKYTCRLYARRVAFVS